MQAISLYWITASMLRQQKIDLFDVKFRAEFNELSLFL